MTATSLTPRTPLTPQRGSRLAGRAYWAMVQRVVLIAAAIDVGYILLFVVLGSWPLAVVNGVSIAMYLGAYRLIQLRHNAAALVLIWVEVLGHSALGSLLIGWESGFHYFLLMMIPAVVIANTRGLVGPMVGGLLVYYLGLQAVCELLGPLKPLPAASVKIVNWVHICLVFAMSSALADFYRRTILIAEERLRKLATQDSLTGLANRSHFEALATHALARSQRQGEAVTLLMCDVDLFKQVNDEHGHAAGDDVLVAMAKVLSANLREGDVLARWGGEEFLALMPASAEEAACATAERIRAAVEQAPLCAGQAPIHVTMSFGVARVHSADDLPAAIARADKALYQSKHAGRNRVSVV